MRPQKSYFLLYTLNGGHFNWGFQNKKKFIFLKITKSQFLYSPLFTTVNFAVPYTHFIRVFTEKK